MQEEGKNWDFIVFFSFDVVNPYCITSLTVSMVPTSWFPAFFVELGIASGWLFIFAIIGPWIPIWANTNMLGVCTLQSMFYLWYSCMYPAKVGEKKTSGYIFHTKDPATLAADAVVRQTVFEFSKKKFCIWRVWLSLWYCRVAWVRDASHLTKY